MVVDVIFVVNVQDFAYQKPMIKIRYAGKSAMKAYESFRTEVASNDGKKRITLDVIEGSFSQRLETHENKVSE